MSTWQKDEVEMTSWEPEVVGNLSERYVDSDAGERLVHSCPCCGGDAVHPESGSPDGYNNYRERGYMSSFYPMLTRHPWIDLVKPPISQPGSRLQSTYAVRWQVSKNIPSIYQLLDRFKSLLNKTYREPDKLKKQTQNFMAQTDRLLQSGYPGKDNESGWQYIKAGSPRVAIQKAMGYYFHSIYNRDMFMTEAGGDRKISKSELLTVTVYKV